MEESSLPNDIWIHYIIPKLKWSDFVKLFSVSKNFGELAIQAYPYMKKQRAVDIIERFWLRFVGSLHTPKSWIEKYCNPPLLNHPVQRHEPILRGILLLTKVMPDEYERLEHNILFVNDQTLSRKFLSEANISTCSACVADEWCDSFSLLRGGDLIKHILFRTVPFSKDVLITLEVNYNPWSADDQQVNSNEWKQQPLRFSSYGQLYWKLNDLGIPNNKHTFDFKMFISVNKSHRIEMIQRHVYVMTTETRNRVLDDRIPQGKFA